MKRFLALTIFITLCPYSSPAAATDFHCEPGSSVVPEFVDGNVIVVPGASCIGSGSQIKGNVVVLPDAIAFHLHGGVVEGNVQAESPQLDIRIFDALITGSIQIKKMHAGATGAICRSEIMGDVILEENAGITTIGIGFPSDVCNAGNLIHGNVKIQKNNISPPFPLTTDQVIRGNTIQGDLQVEENSGTLRIEENLVRQNLQIYKNGGTTTVILNESGSNLQCFDNAVIAGTANTALNKEGQCAAF